MLCLLPKGSPHHPPPGDRTHAPSLAAFRLEADTAGYDFGKFRVDRRARQLVERNLEILSEASRRLPKELKEGEAHLPWRAIAGIGNVLRHDYHETYPTILWETSQKDLETLKEAVGRIAQRVSTVPRRKLKKA